MSPNGGDSTPPLEAKTLSGATQPKPPRLRRVRVCRGHGIGVRQTVVPERSEVGIRPALMIRASGTSTAAGPFAENAAQTPAYPSVETAKHRAVAAVLEIDEPSPQGAVHVRHDALHTLSRSTPGLGSYRLL